MITTIAFYGLLSVLFLYLMRIFLCVWLNRWPSAIHYHWTRNRNYVLDRDLTMEFRSRLEAAYYWYLVPVYYNQFQDFIDPYNWIASRSEAQKHFQPIDPPHTLIPKPTARLCHGCLRTYIIPAVPHPYPWYRMGEIKLMEKEAELWFWLSTKFYRNNC